jgi:hypothetical protein
MNSIIQQQQSTSLQIAGVIRNFRKVPTRTGKRMAAFTLGTLPSKCFDVTVDTVEYFAATGKRVLVAGHLSNHDGTIEFVAQSINLAPAGQTDAQTDFTHGGYADISAQESAPIRESSTITENLSGCVSDPKSVPNRSGRPMITFKIGNSSCKAFRELATAIQKAEGKQIEVSARKGSFRGATEYAVEIVKTICGTAVNLRDISDLELVTVSPTSCVERKNRQIREFVAFDENEGKQITEAIAEPKVGQSQTDKCHTFLSFDNVDVVPDDWANWIPRILPGPLDDSLSNLTCRSKLETIGAETKAEPATEAVLDPKAAPAEEVVVEKTPEVQGPSARLEAHSPRTAAI